MIRKSRASEIGVQSLDQLNYGSIPSVPVGMGDNDNGDIVYELKMLRRIMEFGFSQVVRANVAGARHVGDQVAVVAENSKFSWKAWRRTGTQK